MPKNKSAAEMFVADGAGGMRPVSDLRFEEGEWPIQLVVPATDAGTWMEHLAAEAETRDWGMSSFGQIDAAENSGTISITMGPPPATEAIEIVWEKERRGALVLQARASSASESSLDAGRALLEAVSTRQREGTTIRVHRRALMTYNGLPWRGELWLDDATRLGPPSKFPDTLFGPQVVVVDAMITGIGSHGVVANFSRLLREIQLFMTAVVGMRLNTSKWESDWVCVVNEQGAITDCRLAPVGYVELSPEPDFPEVGRVKAIERRDCPRPGLGPFGITSDMHERWMPADVEQLWEMFKLLPADKREQFLRAANAHMVAGMLWPDQRTAYAAFLVVACEALKPKGKRNEKVNVYDVVASLVGVDEARWLQAQSLAPQKIRSRHLHRGELAAGELLPMMMHDHFRDPSFDNMLRGLSPFTRICLIEWLRCNGDYELVRMPRDKCSRSRKIRSNVRRMTGDKRKRRG